MALYKFGIIIIIIISGSGPAQRPLAQERGYQCRGPEFPVTCTPLLMGPVCLHSQHRFEQQVRS